MFPLWGGDLVNPINCSSLPAICRYYQHTFCQLSWDSWDTWQLICRISSRKLSLCRTSQSGLLSILRQTDRTEMAAIPTKSWVCIHLSHLSPLTPFGIYVSDKGQCCYTEKLQLECGQNCTQNWAAALMEPSDYHCLHLCENAGFSQPLGAGSKSWGYRKGFLLSFHHGKQHF